MPKLSNSPLDYPILGPVPAVQINFIIIMDLINNTDKEGQCVHICIMC